MAGIKETKEVLIAANEVAVFVTSRLKDGAQIEDFQAFYDKFVFEPEFKAKLEAAYDNVKAVPEELGDLSVVESVELGLVQLGYIPKYIAALIKKS